MSLVHAEYRPLHTEDKKSDAAFITYHTDEPQFHDTEKLDTSVQKKFHKLMATESIEKQLDKYAK